MREALPDLLKVLGYRVEAFSSGEDFLASKVVGETQCLLLDVAMPGMSGPDLERELTLRGHKVPIVFITARGNGETRRRLLKHGAAECLFKPFSDSALRAALAIAIPGK